MWWQGKRKGERHVSRVLIVLGGILTLFVIVYGV